MANRALLISAACLALAASFFATAADTYKVSASLLHNGEPFGEPTVVVKGDTPATVTVTGPEGYAVSFTVSDLAPDKLQVAATLESAHGSLSPVLVARPGTPVTVTVGGLGLTVTVQRVGI